MPLLWMRCIILALSFVGISCFYLWGQREKRLTKVIPEILILLNVALFHVWRLIGLPTDVYLLNNWSILIHFQVALSLAVGGVLLFISRGR